jgi:hypothetical protein
MIYWLYDGFDGFTAVFLKRLTQKNGLVKNCFAFFSKVFFYVLSVSISKISPPFLMIESSEGFKMKLKLSTRA